VGRGSPEASPRASLKAARQGESLGERPTHFCSLIALRKSIDQFYSTWEENDEDKLTEGDWDIIEKVSIRIRINISSKLLTKH
jgi:hypothetical protein